MAGDSRKIEVTLMMVSKLVTLNASLTRAKSWNTSQPSKNLKNKLTENNMIRLADGASRKIDPISMMALKKVIWNASLMKVK